MKHSIYVLLAILLVIAKPASADCLSRVDAIQEQIQETVTGPLSEDQSTQLWILLTDLCGNEGESVSASTGEGEDESVNVLGLEIKKAGPDSRGRERLKKKR